MSYSKRFKELDKSKHDRASFDCGEKELNDFIQTQAAKHMQAGISRTLVLPASAPLPNKKYKSYHVILSLFFFWLNLPSIKSFMGVG